MKQQISALLLGTALALRRQRGALAQDKTIKIGVLTDNSGLYSDLGGAGSTLAAQMAVEDSGWPAKGWKIDVISADHQNKPDIGTNIARQWIDVDKVDVFVDVLNSGVALAVNNVVKEKNAIMINSGAATSDLTNAQCSPNTIHWVYDTYMLANSTGQALVKAGGDTWFFLTADYAFGHALERDTTAVVTQVGGKVIGGVKHPLNTVGLLLVPAAGAGLEGQDHRPCQCRRRHHQLDQAGGGIRHRRGRPEARGPAAVHHRRPRARPEGRAGPELHRNLLLGPERRDPRVLQALLRAHEEQGAAVDGAGRRLFGPAALLQGAGGAWAAIRMTASRWSPR